MADITNLSLYRKQQARAKKRSRGDQNAALFGRTKAEKLAELDARTRADAYLNAHLREAPTGLGEPRDD